MTRTGTYACGQLRVSCACEPLAVAVCHCLECQRRTGSPYGVGAFFARENVTATGTSRSFRRAADSGFAVVFRSVRTAARPCTGSRSANRS
jgi:hypothetical protein